jgi:hypothetical protein
MQLSEHFSLEEMTASETAARMGIYNVPPPQVVENLRLCCAGLEEVRTILNGKPIHINSGYRGAKLNAAIGGATNSAHMSGFAADIICPEFGTPQQLMRAIAPKLTRFDQLILEGTWLHVSFAPQNRRQLLQAHFGGSGVTYTVLGP